MLFRGSISSERSKLESDKKTLEYQTMTRRDSVHRLQDSIQRLSYSMELLVLQVKKSRIMIDSLTKGRSKSDSALKINEQKSLMVNNLPFSLKDQLNKGNGDKSKLREEVNELEKKRDQLITENPSINSELTRYGNAIQGAQEERQVSESKLIARLDKYEYDSIPNLLRGWKESQEISIAYMDSTNKRNEEIARLKNRN